MKKLLFALIFLSMLGFASAGCSRSYGDDFSGRQSGVAPLCCDSSNLMVRQESNSYSDYNQDYSHSYNINYAEPKYGNTRVYGNYQKYKEPAGIVDRVLNYRRQYNGGIVDAVMDYHSYFREKSRGLIYRETVIREYYG